MNIQLPRHLKHLQELLDGVPESHKHYGRLHMRRYYLKVERPKNGEQGVARPCRYWSAATGNEIDIELHPPKGKTAIMIGTLEKQTGSVLLGRAPDFPQNHFRQWHGDKEEFGWEEDGDYDEDYDRYLVVKSVDRPDWVDEVRKGAKYRDVTEGKQENSLEQTDSAAADESDGDIGDIPYEQQSNEPMSSQRSPTRSRSVRSHRATRSSSTWYGSNEDNGEITASAAEKSADRARAPAAPVTSQVQPPTNPTNAGARASRSHRKPRPASSKKPDAISKDDDAVMLDGGPGDYASVGSDSSGLNNLRVQFKASNAGCKPRSCRWQMCNTVHSLFDHALLGGVLNRNDSPMGLWIAVKTSGKDVRGSPFGIARADTDTFGELCSAPQRILGNTGLHRTTVEVTQA